MSDITNSITVRISTLAIVAGSIFVAGVVIGAIVF
jgi:hypothetical protein